MPQVRRMPNGDLVRFPDTDTEWDIQQFILRHFPPEDPDMLESTSKGDDIYQGWYEYLDKNRPENDPQKQMLLRALQEYNKELGREDIPPQPKPSISDLV